MLHLFVSAIVRPPEDGCAAVKQLARIAAYRQALVRGNPHVRT